MMDMYFYLIFFVFGICLGSFYNVLGFRVPNNQSIIKPKSHCPKCNHELTWCELIPILSFLIQKGKCKCCKTKLSLFYPFIEFATGLLFVVSYHSFGFSLNLIIALTLVSLFMIVIVSDLTYLIIPDSFIVIPCIIVFFVKVIELGFLGGLIQLGYGILTFILMYLIMLFGNKIFKKESLGGADIKLMFLVGLTLDPMLASVVIFLASITALPVSIFLLIKKKEHVIPYGPFLVFGLLVVFFLKLNIIEIFNKLLFI